MEKDQSMVFEPIIQKEEPLVAQAPRWFTRTCYLPKRYEEIILVEDNEPSSYEEILKSSKLELWLKAIKSEMNSMYDNQV